MLINLKLKDYITLGGTVTGLFAIFLVITPYHAFRAAMFLVFLAVFMDLLDGYIARRSGDFNAFGIQIDSLNDEIAFGVAPAVIYMMAYSALTDSGLNEFGITPVSPWMMFIASFIFIAAGIVRLAWFNVSEKTDVYEGMPIPVAASILMFFMLGDYFVWLLDGRATWYNKVMNWFLPFFIIFLGWCMVTKHLLYGRSVRKKTGYAKYLFWSMGGLLIVLAVLVSFWREEAKIVILICVFLYMGMSVWFIVLGMRTARREAMREKTNSSGENHA